jgi:DUF2946 family protein
MPQLARRLLIASLIALHATVVLYGPCLHGLPGWDHGTGLARNTEVNHVGDPVKAAHVQPDNCPICHFFAQGQLPIDLACAPVVDQVFALKQEPWSESVTPTLLLPTSPRAPPAIPANRV